MTPMGTPADTIGTGRTIRQQQGDAIRRLRRLRRLTIHDFASAVGVNDSSVSHWETARYSPRQELQVKIAHVLDVKWIDIFGIDSDAA